MAMYTNIERTDMVLIYGEARGNAEEARRIYMERFPQRLAPAAGTFIKNVQHLRDHGTFKPQTQDRGRVRTRRILDVEPQILHTVEAEPGISTRRLAVRHGISQFIAWRTLKEQGLHPYHVQKVQALQPGDPARRQVFCRWLLHKAEEQPNFVNNLLTTDEAGFTRDGVFNMHNTHVWADENPHAIWEHRFQRKFHVNVWAGLVGGRLIGPHVLPPRLNGVRYLHFLENVLVDLLDDIPLDVRQNVWFLHDGAPPHNAREVRDWLDHNYNQRWIGRGGPVLWPARSPDLNPCDFYLWGHLKQLVYATPVDSVEELVDRIENAAQTIRQNPAVLSRVQESLIRRARACLDNNGLHFEQFL